jgi:hypothetical protein
MLLDSIANRSPIIVLVLAGDCKKAGDCPLYRSVG